MKLSRFTSLILFSFLVLTLTQCSKTTGGSPNSATTLDSANNDSVSASAKDLLTGDKPVLVFEINYMTGYALQNTTLTNVTNFLNTYTRKGSLQVIQKEIAASGKDSLSIKDIDLIERQNRTAFNTANQVAVYILITDGTYNPVNTLGFAYRNTSITLFGKAIKNYSGRTNQVPTAKLETNTLEHEFGHLFGLVNLGSAMQVNHEDVANLKHCNNSKCLMYYQTESTGFLGTLMNSSISSFDTNCHNDLIANGGK